MEVSTTETHITTPEVTASSGWRRVLSVGVGVGLLAWVLSQLNLVAFWLALSKINHLAYLGFMFLFVLALLAADSAAIASVYVRYVCKVRFREVFVLKGCFVPTSRHQLPYRTSLADMVCSKSVSSEAGSRGRRNAP